MGGTYSAAPTRHLLGHLLGWAPTRTERMGVPGLPPGCTASVWPLPSGALRRCALASRL